MKFEVGDRIVVIDDSMLTVLKGRTGIVTGIPRPGSLDFLRVDLDENSVEGKDFPFRANELEWEPRWEEQQACKILGEEYFA